MFVNISYKCVCMYIMQHVPYWFMYFMEGHIICVKMNNSITLEKGRHLCVYKKSAGSFSVLDHLTKTDKITINDLG